MENREEQLSHKQSLELIEEMIYKAKDSYHESGTSALLWGSIIMFCSAVSFANTWLKLNWLNQIWLLTIIAVIPQIIISIREAKAQKFKSHTDDAMNGIWISFGISIFLASLYINSVKVEGSGILFLILYGIPTFATGFTHRFKPMIIGGIVCWAAAIVSMVIRNSIENLPMVRRIELVLFFVSAFFAWLLPGLILRNDYLKQKKANV